MEVDHIIIFSNHKGEEANELIGYGLTEGSHRVHAGQGTRNRKFYFENFFLEIVWVSNESEITNESTAPTKLWERTNYKINGSSPFGLCLTKSADTDPLFENCLKYRPDYLPSGLSFDIITNEKTPYLPWTCRIPNIGKNMAPEPTLHQIGVEKLTKVTFGIRNGVYHNRFTDFLSRQSIIRFQNTEDHSLTLEFDNMKHKKILEFTELPLIIEY